MWKFYENIKIENKNTKKKRTNYVKKEKIEK